ncbi:hypothetical protein BG011_004318 [Mortierella polycephala]|uniref:Uncharacterized protein n=1 Tax=Mortierella polycephala TaxID=41804 RepID=A0A9P6Q200_9FUNG|nr:hypothetical protein BG011_004318 [Mortierella polycephala]
MPLNLEMQPWKFKIINIVMYSFSLDPPRIPYYPNAVLKVFESDSLSSFGSNSNSPKSSLGITTFFASPISESYIGACNDDYDEEEGSVRRPRSPQRKSSNHLQETEFGKYLVDCSKNMTLQGRKSVAEYSSLYESFVEATMTGRDQQIESIKFKLDDMMASMIREMTTNQAQLLERDREAKALQESIAGMQTRMFRMQEEALNRLSAIQSRIQALITQNYELFEYPIPRLFIVLPKESGKWDKLNPFTRKFRLYFLCECGEHTRKKSSSNKMPHHIHLAKHEGYDIVQPTEFFMKYGPYLLTMMEMVKYGVVAAGVVVPALTQLTLLDGINEIKDMLSFSKENLEPLLNESMSYVKRHIDQDQPGVDFEGERELAEQEALEGADLRQLASFLNDADEARVLGNLFRTITGEGHVKWVCFDHYRDGYMELANKRFAEIVNANGGRFREDLGRVEIKLSTHLTAQEFYDALKRVKGVHELVIEITWDAIKWDIQQLCNVITESNVSILTVDGKNFHRPPSDLFHRKSRFDPFIHLLAKGKLQSFTIKNCPRFLDRISGATYQTLPTLRALHLDYGDVRMESYSAIHKIVNLLQRSPNLTEATVGCSDLDKMFTYLQEPIQHLPRLVSLKLIQEQGVKEVAVTFSETKTRHMDIKVKKKVPKLAYSGHVRRIKIGSKKPSIPDVRRILIANQNLTRLDLKTSENHFKYIFLIDSMMPKRCHPLLVVIAEPLIYSRPIKLEFWNATKVQPTDSVGKWIPWHNSMIHVQEWCRNLYNFEHVNKDAAVFLSLLAEMVCDADEVKLDLDLASLSDTGIRAMLKAMTYLKPKGCRMVCKEYREELAYCYDFDPACWSRLRVLEVSGKDIATWLHRPASGFQRESMPLLERLIVKGQGSHVAQSGELAEWLASMVSPKKSCRRLVTVTLKSVHFAHEDWRTVLGSIDYSSLETIILHACGIAEAFPGYRRRLDYTAADLYTNFEGGYNNKYKDIADE